MTLASYRKWASVPNKGQPRLSVVIPTYNEEWRILPTVGAIATHISSLGFEWEMIIADDGSSDSTVDLVRSADLANLNLLVADTNQGKGSAVRRGVLASRGEYVLFADADQSTPIEQMDLLLDPIRRNEADVTIGSRSTDGAEVRGKSLARHAMSKGLNALVRRGLGLDIDDTQCGFKLFEANAARHLFSLQTIDGFSFDLEVLYLAKRHNYRVLEVPVEWIDAPGSTVAPIKVAFLFVLDLFKIRWHGLRRQSTGRGRPLRPSPSHDMGHLAASESDTAKELLK